ncbi:MAG: alpha/beta fold hydrolase [Chloroflexaceae bacterium]|nr:alpha/beta fold hydrolase [Chloroflexaceae bacterium]
MSGTGRSDKPVGPYSQELHTRDLVALLDAFHVSRAHILGLSNGGTIALTLAVTVPERVERLVLVDTFAYADAVMRSKLHTWLAALDLGGTMARFDAALPWVWGRDILQRSGDAIIELRERAAEANIEAQRALIHGTLNYDIRHRLCDISAPTRVIVGEEDVLTPPWYARELVAHIPNADLVVIPGAAHVPTIERPDVLNSRVLSFLQAQY